MHEHPRFATPSGHADNTQEFSPEKSASFAPPSLRGHVPDFSAVLSGSEEPAAFSYGQFAELGARANVPDEAAEPLHYQKEPPMSFGDIKILMKVGEAASPQKHNFESAKSISEELTSDCVSRAF